MSAGKLEISFPPSIFQATPPRAYSLGSGPELGQLAEQLAEQLASLLTQAATSHAHPSAELATHEPRPSYLAGDTLVMYIDVLMTLREPHPPAPPPAAACLQKPGRVLYEASSTLDLRLPNFLLSILELPPP